MCDDEHPCDSPTVRQEIDLDADAADVWRLISDPDELAAWLGGSVDVVMRPGEVGSIVDDDGTRYDVLVTDVEDGRRVAWHWWAAHGELSSVEITLEPAGDATRLRVVERLVRPDAAPVASASCGHRWERASLRLWQSVAAHACAW